MTKLEKIILELNNDEIESLLITDIKNNSLAIKIANAINTQTGWVARNSDKIDWYDHKKDTCNHEYDEKVFDVSDVPEDITMSFVKRALFFNECKLCGHIKYDTKSFGIIWR